MSKGWQKEGEGATVVRIAARYMGLLADRREFFPPSGTKGTLSAFL